MEPVPGEVRTSLITDTNASTSTMLIFMYYILFFIGFNCILFILKVGKYNLISILYCTILCMYTTTITTGEVCVLWSR